MHISSNRIHLTLAYNRYRWLKGPLMSPAFHTHTTSAVILISDALYTGENVAPRFLGKRRFGGENRGIGFPICSFLDPPLDYIGRSSPTASSLESQDHKLPPTLRVPYQSGTSSSPGSSPSSGSDRGPVADVLRGFFHCRLKNPFSQSLFLHSNLWFNCSCRSGIWPLYDWQLAVTGDSGIGECGSVSQSSWLLGALQHSYLLTHLLTYLLTYVKNPNGSRRLFWF